MWYLIEAIIILALCGGVFVWAASRSKSRLSAFAEQVAEVDAARTPRRDRGGSAGWVKTLIPTAGVITSPSIWRGVPRRHQ